MVRRLLLTVLLGVGTLAYPAYSQTPPVQGGTVNIEDYGAIANDGLQDTLAIRNAVEAINNVGGGTVYFPAGIWDIWQLPLSAAAVPDIRQVPLLTQPLRSVTLLGDGDTTILRREPGTDPANDQRPIMTVTNADYFTMRAILLDMNQLARFGGAKFLGCRHCTVEETTITDLDPPPLPEVGDYSDRYALIFGFGSRHNIDITLRANTITNLGVEVDHVEGALIQDNIVTLPTSTTGLGLFALRNNRIARNLRFIGNFVYNPRKMAITVVLDGYSAAAPRVGSMVENVEISNNQVHYTSLAPAVAIRVGVPNNSIATTCNTFRDVTIESNEIHVTDGLPVSANALISGNNSVTANILFDAWSVQHNRLYSTAERTFVDIRAGAAGGSVVETDNLWIVP